MYASLHKGMTSKKLKIVQTINTPYTPNVLHMKIILIF